MDFVAIDVPKGDSFFLYDPLEKRTFLVDGGTENYSSIYTGITNKVLFELLSRDTTHLDVLICTHYDYDHISGVIGLLEDYIFGSKGFSIGELWLPDFFRRLAATWRYNVWGIQTRIDDPNFINIFTDDQMEHEIEIRRIHGSKSPIDMTVKIINRLIYNCFEFIILGGRIRWLEYDNNVVDALVSTEYKMYGINCYEVKRSISFYTEEELIFHLTRINEESLVFRYNEVNEDLPNILFTSDSDFSFCHSKTVNYNPSTSIITTPHHGSNHPRHENVYNSLYSIGRNFTLVRSDFSGSGRPKSTPPKYNSKFLSHNVISRFCTNCNDGSRWGNLSFRFDSSWSQVSTASCKCT